MIDKRSKRKMRLKTDTTLWLFFVKHVSMNSSIFFILIYRVSLKNVPSSHKKFPISCLFCFLVSKYEARFLNKWNLFMRCWKIFLVDPILIQVVKSNELSFDVLHRVRPVFFNISAGSFPTSLRIFRWSEKKKKK